MKKTTTVRMNRSIMVYSFNDIVHGYKMTKKVLQLKLLRPTIFYDY